MRGKKIKVTLRDGQRVVRTLRYNRQGYYCIKYLGQWVFVECAQDGYREYTRV